MQIKNNKSNINSLKSGAMFFAAHPDDAELNCGGTILSLVSSGRSVGIVDLTLGELSTRGNLKLRKKRN
ncbi:MAG: PIG-L family deacetylase [Ignavibacteria bacterium]